MKKDVIALSPIALRYRYLLNSDGRHRMGFPESAPTTAC